MLATYCFHILFSCATTCALFPSTYIYTMRMRNIFDFVGHRGTQYTFFRALACVRISSASVFNVRKADLCVELKGTQIVEFLW